MNKKAEQEKKELMDKVFGKDAPNRKLTEKDLAVLKTNPFTGEEISAELQTLKENSEKLKAQTDKIYDVISDSELDALNASLKKDFGTDFPLENESSLNIVYDNESLNKTFNEIEENLKTKIFKQDDYISSLCKAFKRPFVMGQQKSGLNGFILITGQDDTNQKESIEEIAKQLKEKNLIRNDAVITIDLDNYTSKEDENNFVIDLYGAINNGQIIYFENIQSISPSYLSYIEEIVLEGKLSLSKRYVLNNKQLVETTNSLAKNTVKEISFAGKYLIFTTSLKTSKLLNVVGSRFLNNVSDSLKTNALSAEDVAEILPKKFATLKNRCQSTLSFNITYDESLINYALEKYAGDNTAFIDSLFERIYKALSEFKLSNPDTKVTDIAISYKDGQLFISEEALNKYVPEENNNTIEEVKKELDNLVGLTEVKNYIYSLQDFYSAQQMRKSKGLGTTEVSKHMIFTGNPGTGKTTIARLLAKYLKAIGVLSNGQLIEVSRSDLVGKFVGHTAPLTMQVIKSALGGILFIDEAYSLYRGENDSFGLEAIDTLVKAMEDNREDLIVILAGYTKEMKTFLQSNSGLQSRFPNQIEFPDYTGEELFKIAKINAKSAGYRIDEAAEKPLTDYFTKVQENDSVRSGNGRLSRNKVEDAILNQSKRIINNENAEIDLLLLEDFELD